MHKDVFINTGTQRPMRAPGHPQGSFITEVLMEELADLVKMDPVEFRLKNLPPEAPNAMWGAYLRQGAKEFGWDKRHPTGDPTPGPIKTGMGVAINTWGGGGRGPCARRDRVGRQRRRPLRHAGSRHRHANAGRRSWPPKRSGFRSAISSRRSATRSIRSAADRAAAPPRRGISPAIRIATVNALDALQEEGRAGAGRRSRNRSSRSNGRIQVKDNSVEGHGVGGRMQADWHGADSVDGEWQPGCRGHGTSGVQFAEATVDIETGIVKVMRILAMQDCGLVVRQAHRRKPGLRRHHRPLNFALFEDRILDRDTGQMVNPNMEWYLLAGMSDIPKIDVVLRNMPERGVIGIGEPPTVSTAAAIANAVRNAIGVTVRSLPLTPAQDPADAGEQERGRRDAVKAFAYVNPANEKDAVAALKPGRQGDADRRRPGPAGADEGLHHSARPHRQRQERARRDGHGDAGRRAEDRRGGEDRRTWPSTRRSAKLYPAIVAAAGRSRHAADSQSGDRRRQPQPAAALLVLPQRRVRLLQEGRLALLRRHGENQYHAIFGNRPEPHRPSVEPCGAVGRRGGHPKGAGPVLSGTPGLRGSMYRGGEAWGAGGSGCFAGSYFRADVTTAGRQGDRDASFR